MIHVYAFAAAPVAPPQLAGLGDAPLESLTVAEIAVVVSRHERAPEATEEAVRRHAEVVEAVMRDAGAVLPARFGQAFAGEAALEGALVEQADGLRERLSEVKGCVELGVRAFRTESDAQPAPPRSGRDYLHARLREASERERLAAELHDSLSVIARASTHRVPPSGRVLLTGAYLVPAGDRDGFEEQVRELERTHGDVAVVCTGPWPPYSFAGTEAA